MPAGEIEKTCKQKMAKAVEFFKQELRGIRTGQANPALVDHLKVEVSSYGSTMELRELATISVPDPGTLLIKPFDPGTLKDIERAIQISDLGIAPQNDGKAIRLPIPPLSGERREQLVAQVRKMAEAQKVAVRNARRDANKAIDTAEKKDKTLSEDQAKDLKDRIQKLTRQFEDEIDRITKEKSQEIETV
ncbi:MAG: ribosome recycling factor [Planctomycetota bacterium]|nr:MAG: ribosome recycling factor [Planctomycetota bacterium]